MGQSPSGEELGGLLEEGPSALGPEGLPDGNRQAKERRAFQLARTRWGRAWREVEAAGRLESEE